MKETAFLSHGAGLLAFALSEGDADVAELRVQEQGHVVIILRKGAKIMATGRVPRHSSFVRWSPPETEEGE
jgi:hypothetical protein